MREKWETPVISIATIASIVAARSLHSTQSVPAFFRKWKLAEALWIADRYHEVLDPPCRAIVDGIVEELLSIQDALNALPAVAIPNDVNDRDVLIDGSLLKQARVTGLIDLGDMRAAPHPAPLLISPPYSGRRGLARQPR